MALWPDHPWKIPVTIGAITAPIKEGSGDIGLGRLIQPHGMQTGIMAISRK